MRLFYNIIFISMILIISGIILIHVVSGGNIFIESEDIILDSNIERTIIPSLNITEKESIDIANILKLSIANVTLAEGVEFESIIFAISGGEIGYYTFDSNTSGRELGLNIQNNAMDTESSQYIAAVNGYGNGHGWYKFSTNKTYNDIIYSDAAVEFNNKGGYWLYGYWNDEEVMTRNNSGLTFGVASGFIENDNGSVTWYNNTIDAAHVNNDSWFFSVPVIFDDKVYLNRSIVKLSITENQTIENSMIWRNISWDDVIFNDNMFNVSDNNSTIIINRDGKYSITYHIKIESNDKVQYESRVIKNGVALETSNDVNFGSKDLSYITLQNAYNCFDLNEDDEIVLQIRHSNVGSHVLFEINTYVQVIEID